MAPLILGLENNLLNLAKILNISFADEEEPKESLKFDVIVASTDSIAISYYLIVLVNYYSPSLLKSNTSTFLKISYAY